MLSEGFSEGWVENNGVQPVVDDTKVEVIWSDGSKNVGFASGWRWYTVDSSVNIVRWRLHIPSKLPQPVRPATPMPAIKPPKKEDVFVEVPEIDPWSQSKVVQAFNRMTGHNITDDNLNTLKVLVELFSNETFGK